MIGEYSISKIDIESLYRPLSRRGRCHIEREFTEYEVKLPPA
jgi:hypothetical protein